MLGRNRERHRTPQDGRGVWPPSVMVEQVPFRPNSVITLRGAALAEGYISFVDLAAFAGSALSRVIPAPRGADVQPGRMMELPGRGRTCVVDIAGPEGAPTLMLLHALGCTAWLSWFPSVHALSQHFRVVMFDQRWHGRGIRSERFRIADCADDVSAVADVVGVDQYIPVGYSMGSIVAQATWRRQRDRVAGLVLCASAQTFQATRRERIGLRLLARSMQTQRFSGYVRERADRLAATLVDQMPLTAEQMRVPQWAMREFRSTSGWAMLAAIGDIGMFDSSAWISRVDVPTSVVVNTEDKMIPTSRQRALAAAIPDAEVFEVAGSHAALVLGADTFVPVLVDACRSVADRIELGVSPRL
jgi:pimeloyl-ACP methyl ester carboxylesterase